MRSASVKRFAPNVRTACILTEDDATPVALTGTAQSTEPWSVWVSEMPSFFSVYQTDLDLSLLIKIDLDISLGNLVQVGS